MTRTGKKLSIPVRVVFYQEEGRWVAHCLEFDLMGDGESIGTAFARLNDAILMQASASVEIDNPGSLFQPADGRVFEMFAAGEHQTMQGALQFTLSEAVDIEAVDGRVYRDAPIACASR